MKNIKEIEVGQTYGHPQLKKVKVIEKPKGNRSNVIVEVVERGKGYSEKTGTFKGHKNRVGWMRGENREFGSIDTVHVKDLEEL